MRARILSALGLIVGLIGLVLLSFTAVAHAADAVVPPEESLLELARPAYEAAMSGHYLAAFAFALVFGVALFKRYAPGKAGAFAKTDVGGVLTTFSMSFFGAVGTATLATGSGWSGLTYSVFRMSAGIAFLAIGGYIGVKKLVIPLMKKYQGKFPAWTQPAFTFAYFLFDKPDPVKTAEAAGETAVQANPAPGVEAVTGKPETF